MREKMIGDGTLALKIQADRDRDVFGAYRGRAARKLGKTGRR